MAHTKGATALRLARQAAAVAIPPVVASAMPVAAAAGIEMRRFGAIDLSPFNPRKHIDDSEIDSLADSIFAKGILQNLVCRPAPAEPAEGRRFPKSELEVAAGERRWRAVARLIAQGRVTADYPVPVKIVPMSDVELVEFAMTENMQRRDMTALEEADGFAWLIEHGRDAETIAASTGYRLPLIRQRLVLHMRLAPEVRRALEGSAINLGQAQAFTLGDKDRQAELVEAVTRAPRLYDAGEIRRLMVERFIPLSRAIFPHDAYKGAVRRDLFRNEEWAEDRAEFERLQGEAAEKKRAELATAWSWTELRRRGYVALGEYDRDESPGKSGAIVHLRDDLRVEIHTGLIKREAAPLPIARSAGATPSPATHRADAKADLAADLGLQPFSKAHVIWAKQEKTRVLQMAVAANPAAATALAIMGLIGSQEVRLHKTAVGGWYGPADRIENKPLRRKIDAALQRLNGDTTPTEAVLFRRLVAMPGEDRRELHALLVAECVGSWPGHDPDIGDSQLAIAIAAACGIDEAPAVTGTPDGVDGIGRFVMTTAYLERLDRKQLQRVAIDSGAEEAADGRLGLMKRDELIDLIALSPTTDRGFFPPELRFATGSTILNALAPPAKRGGGRKANDGVRTG